MAKLVEKVYGDALFQLALEENKVNDFLLEAREIQNCILNNTQMTQFMSHPGIAKKKKISLVEEILGNHLSKEIVGFLVLIIEKGHYNQLKDILIYFKNQVKEYKHIGVVSITTPSELKVEQMTQIEEKLLRTTTYEKLEAHYYVDESLIGGMIIRMKDRLIDSSLKTKLEKLTKELLNIRVS